MSDDGVNTADMAGGTAQLDLAPEILRLIFQSIDRQADEASLLNARLVNRSWHQQATEVLWHEPNLRMVNQFVSRGLPMNVPGISKIRLTKDFDELMPLMSRLQGLRLKEVNIGSEDFDCYLENEPEPLFGFVAGIPIWLVTAGDMVSRFAAYSGLLALMSDSVTSFRYYPTNITGQRGVHDLMVPPPYKHIFRALATRCPRLEYLSLGTSTTDDDQDSIYPFRARMAPEHGVLDGHLINLFESLQALKHVELGSLLYIRLDPMPRTSVFDYLFERRDLKTVRLRPGRCAAEWPRLGGLTEEGHDSSSPCPQVRSLPHAIMDIARACRVVERVPNVEDLALCICGNEHICPVVQRLGKLSGLTRLTLDIRLDDVHAIALSVRPEDLMPLTSCTALRELTLVDSRTLLQAEACWSSADRHKFLTSFPHLVYFKYDNMMPLETWHIVALGIASPGLKKISMYRQTIDLFALRLMSSNRPLFPALTNLMVDTLLGRVGGCRGLARIDLPTLSMLCSEMPKLERLDLLDDDHEIFPEPHAAPSNLFVSKGFRSCAFFGVPRTPVAEDSVVEDSVVEDSVVG